MAENVDRVRTAYESLAKGDPGPLVDLMHDEITWIEPDGAPGVGAMTKDSGVYRGRDDVLQRMFGRLPEIWSDFSTEPHTYIDGGDHIVVLGHLRGTAPETGERAEAPSAHVWRFEGDRCVHWQCYEDTALLHRAKGAL